MTKGFVKRELKRIAENYHPLFITIMGISGSGKTNLAFLYATRLTKIYGLDRFYFHIQPEKIKEEGVHIFDDFTYLLRFNTQFAQDFARHVQLIRHDFPKNMAIIFISHYVHALLPIFRMAQIRFLTSLTSRYEIELMKRYFDLTALWDFYYKYLSRQKHIALANFNGFNFILIDIKLSKIYKGVMEKYGKIPKEIYLSEFLKEKEPQNR